MHERHANSCIKLGMTNLTGWYSGNAVNLYSGRTSFDLDAFKALLRIFVIFPGLLWKMSRQYL
jgi:hypothetical protein